MSLWKAVGRLKGKKPVDFSGRTLPDHRCQSCGSREFLIDDECARCAPRLHADFDRQGGHLQIHPVIAQYGDWVVTEYGVECVSQRYFLDKARVWEADWEPHMGEKRGVAIANFVSALEHARRQWPMVGVQVPVQTKYPSATTWWHAQNANDATTIRSFQGSNRHCSVCGRKRGYRPYIATTFVSAACESCRSALDRVVLVRGDGVMKVPTTLLGRPMALTPEVVNFTCDSCGVNYRHVRPSERHRFVMADGVFHECGAHWPDIIPEGHRGERCESCWSRGWVPERPMVYAGDERADFGNRDQCRYVWVQPVDGVRGIWACESCPYCHGRHQYSFLGWKELYSSPCSPPGRDYRVWTTLDRPSHGEDVSHSHPIVVFSRWGQGDDSDMREPIVKVFKDEKNNGSFAIATTAKDAPEFLAEASRAIANLPELIGDGEFTLEGLLPQVCAIWAKMQGYKADSVYERRVLIAGQPNPEAHMRLLNQPIEVAASHEPEPVLAEA
jgi:hypothetical protein